MQGEQALQRASGGLGLGLAIVQQPRRAARRHVAARSEGPAGQPLHGHAAGVAGAGARGRPPRGRAGRAAPRRRALLIVDDNEDAAQSLAPSCSSSTATRSGRAGDGARALAPARRVRARRRDPRHRPARPWTATSWRGALRADPRRARPALIALTGYGREPDRRRALEAGFDEHLVKPVDFAVLLARLGELLARDPALAG